MGIGGLVIYPIWRSMEHDHEKLVAQERELATIEADRKNMENFEKLSEERVAEFSQLETVFVDLDPPVRFIEFLESEAQRSQLKLNITAGVPQKLQDDRWPSINFLISSKGSYPNFLKFLKKVELSLSAVEIQNLVVTGLGKQETLGEQTRKLPSKDVEFSLTIKAYTK